MPRLLYFCWCQHFSKNETFTQSHSPRVVLENYAAGIRLLNCSKSDKSEKWQWRHNFPIWRDQHCFWGCFISLVKFNYWSNFHVNIITGSGVITIFFYKGLTRNPEIGNTPVWVLPNNCWLDWVRDTKFGTKLHPPPPPNPAMPACGSIFSTGEWIV